MSTTFKLSRREPRSSIEHVMLFEPLSDRLSSFTATTPTGSMVLTCAAFGRSRDVAKWPLAAAPRVSPLQAREDFVNTSPGEADRATIDALVASLEAAWNAGDADAFAAPFAADADFVNVRAEHHRGRAAIAAGHAAILRTVYAGSTVHYTVENTRLLQAMSRWRMYRPSSTRRRDLSPAGIAPCSRSWSSGSRASGRSRRSTTPWSLRLGTADENRSRAGAPSNGPLFFRHCWRSFCSRYGNRQQTSPVV